MREVNGVVWHEMVAFCHRERAIDGEQDDGRLMIKKKDVEVAQGKGRCKSRGGVHTVILQQPEEEKLRERERERERRSWKCILYRR